MWPWCSNGTLQMQTHLVHVLKFILWPTQSNTWSLAEEWWSRSEENTSLSKEIWIADSSTSWKSSGPWGPDVMFGMGGNRMQDWFFNLYSNFPSTGKPAHLQNPTHLVLYISILPTMARKSRVLERDYGAYFWVWWNSSRCLFIPAAWTPKWTQKCFAQPPLFGTKKGGLRGTFSDGFFEVMG